MIPARTAWARAAIALTGLALAVSPLSVASADTSGANLAPLLAADAADAIAGSYIVVLRPGATSESVQSAAASATAAGGTVGYTYATVFKGFAASLPTAALAAVRANPAVDYVETDAMVYLPEDQPAGDQPDPTWGIDRIDQRNLPLDDNYHYNGTGLGVTAYVIDTGINLTHEEFAGRATSGYDFVDRDRDATDCNGHGTHVSGTIGGKTYGVAKKVQLVAVRVFPCAGGASTTRIIKAIEWVIDHADGPSVINMSLGGLARRSMDAAVEIAVVHKISVAVAAGNSAADACNFSPARAPAAITAGASDINDVEASFSNFGECVDVYAPGVNVTSAWIGSDTATNTISGTSMASPHVAGVAALYLGEHPDAGPKEVAKAIRSGASIGKLAGVGPGSPNKLLWSRIV